jgi:uncharacterized membrane protein YfcA
MEWLAGYLAIGAFVGFCAGMLGIGGGAIMVPLLALLFEAQHIPREHLLHLAVGTSMASILFTSLSSVRAHSQHGSLRLDVVKAMTPGILVGGLVGSAIASRISTSLLATLFAVTVLVAAANILRDPKAGSGRALPGRLGLLAVGLGISAISAFAAVGGAFLTVPFLVWCNVPLLQAIGTAAAVGFPIALAGTVGFVASGWGKSGLPEWSVGYVFLPALAGLVVASMLLAPFGAATAHRMPTRRLRQVFILLMFAFALRQLVNLW